MEKALGMDSRVVSKDFFKTQSARERILERQGERLGKARLGHLVEYERNFPYSFEVRILQIESSTNANDNMA